MSTIILKKDPKQKLEQAMLYMSILCSIIWVGSLVRTAVLCYELGKDNADDFIWQLIPESITLRVTAVCCIFIYLIYRNVQQKKVFTMENAHLIWSIGVVIAANGCLMYILKYFMPENPIYQTSMIFILLGFFFIIISCAFKIGVQMREEQELTV